MVIPLLFIPFSETCSFDRFCRMLLPKNLNENTFVTEHLWAYDSLKWSRIEGWSAINCTWEVLYCMYCMFFFNRSEAHHAIGAVAAIAAIGTVAAVVAKVAVVTISAKAATSQIPQILRFWSILWHIVTYCDILWHIVTYCDILWHIVTYCDCVQLTSDCIKDIQGSHLTSTFWKKKHMF